MMMVIIIIIIIIIIITSTAYSHIRHCTHTAESADVKVQNIFPGRNNITCSTDCKYRTAATLYTPEKMVGFRYIIVNTLHKGDNKDDDDDDKNNNNNNNNNSRRQRDYGHKMLLSNRDLFEN
jgi:hypothetical protein